MAAKVKNYNLNETEVRDSDFKNAFPGIFNFTIGILLKIEIGIDSCRYQSGAKVADVRFLGKNKSSGLFLLI